MYTHTFGDLSLYIFTSYQAVVVLLLLHLGAVTGRLTAGWRQAEMCPFIFFCFAYFLPPFFQFHVLLGLCFVFLYFFFYWRPLCLIFTNVTRIFLSFFSFLSDRSSRRAWGLNANATACQVRVPFTHHRILSYLLLYFSFFFFFSLCVWIHLISSE